MGSSSPAVTLFTVQVDSRHQPVMLAASALIHGVIIGLVSFGILNAPRLSAHPGEHYLIRQIDLSSPKTPPLRAAKGITYPGPPAQAAKSAGQQGASGKAAAALKTMAETAHAQPGPQTLVQPDLAVKMALQEKIPIPQILIWKSRQTVVKKIVAPPPAPPVMAIAKPSFAPPSPEVTVSDMNLASTPISQQKLKVMPSTSSPVAVHGLDLAQAAPSTVSQINAKPTPVAVLSLSNLRTEGTTDLPPVNESAMRKESGALAPSQANNGTEAGTAQGQAQGAGQGAEHGGKSGAGPGTEQTGKGAGRGQNTGQTARAGAPVGNEGSAAEGAPGGAASRPGTPGLPNGAATGPSSGPSTGNGQFANTSITDITLPKTGVFSSVVVGNTLQDRYPELSGVWNGRMAYTVYLHVGLARSWILQYSLPAGAALTLNGRADRLEAPWPYSIVRPNLPADSVDADALMVHGFVNVGGRFEGLSVVVPQGFPQAKFVLDSLERWQFRPARANGQTARVEVLLIIPEDQD